MKNKKRCFVIMPVSKTESCTKEEWTDIFEQMIKIAVTGSRLGCTCERAKPRTGNLIKDILNELNTADFVIADLTDTNPNVFYELGVRHTLKNRTILIAQDMKYVPSDLRAYWVIIYEKGLAGIQDFTRKIRETLREMNKNPDKADSPVADFLTERNISLLSQEKSATVKKLAALLSELSHNIYAVDGILKTAKNNMQAREKQQLEVTPVSILRFADASLNLLLSTSYIALPVDVLDPLREVERKIMIANGRLDLWSRIEYAEGVEESLEQTLPIFKDSLVSLMKTLGKLRTDYVNDNYQEPTTPAVWLSKEEHRPFVGGTE